MFEWVKALHEKIYKEEDVTIYAVTNIPTTYTTTAATTIWPTQTYQNYQNLQAVPYLGQGIGIAGVQLGQQPLQPVNTYTSPIQILFVDAAGNSYHLVVDPVHAQYLQQISDHNHLTYGSKIPIAPRQKMVDNEFSLDELDQAEKIIEGLHATKKSEQDQQNCAA